MNFKKYAAELLGTFTLASMVLISIHSGTFTPVVAGFTLGLMVYVIGGVSGAHINPAVTIALATVKKIEPMEAVLYVLSQIVGGLLASFAFQAVVPGGVGLTVDNTVAVGIAEAVGAFFLVLGVSSVVHGKVAPEASGLAIGGSLTAGILMTAGLSNGVLNPAVAIGIGSVSVMYILGPIVGGIVAAWLYKWMVRK